MKKLITIDDLDRWGACNREPGRLYSDENLEAILDGRPGLTPVEVLRETGVLIRNRFWVVLREEVIGAELIYDFARECMSHVGFKKLYIVRYAQQTAADWAGSVAATDRFPDGEAGWYSAFAAFRAAERKWQIQKLIEMIEAAQ